MQIDIFEHIAVFFVIGKGYMLKAYAFGKALGTQRAFALHIFIQRFGQLVDQSLGCLAVGDGGGQCADRLKNIIHHLHKAKHNAQRDISMNHQIGAVEENADLSDIAGQAADQA